MKTVAVVEDGLREQNCYPAYFQKIRRLTGADSIVVIMSGAFLHQAFPAPEDKHTRASKLMDAGADLIVEMPVHGVLLKQDSYVFAIAMLLQKIGGIQQLVVPCRIGSEEILYKAAELMLLTPRAYQQELIRLKKNHDLDEIIPDAVNRFVPGAGAILRNSMDRFAVEVKNALLRSYSPTKVVFLPVDWDAFTPSLSEKADRALGAALDMQMAQMPQSRFEEVFGGSRSVADRLFAARGQNLGFRDMASRLTDSETTPLTARQYLLHCLLDYKNINHSMCALRSYVWCIQVLSGNQDLLSSADAPVVTTDDNESLLSDVQRQAEQVFRSLSI